MASQYEQLRKQNIEDNKRILAQLGLLNPFKPLGRVVKNSVKRKRPASERKEWTPKRQAVEEKENCDTPIRGSRRRSSRLQGKDVQTADELQEEVEKFVEEDESYRPKVQPNRPNVYGPIPGVEVGTVWQTRMEACRAGVHRPPVSGIHGGEEGCYSIALSGGYEDDIDLGECFTYTGEGGRDLKGTKSNPKNLRTAAQSKDQTLTRGNLALYQNVESGHAVRVIRGYKLPSPFAPEDGYRYDGVYTVEKAWFTTGLSGFGVWKFALRRCQDQAPPPWSIVERDSQTDDKIQAEENKAMFENLTTKTDSTEKCKPMKKEDDATDSSIDQKNESTHEQIEESTDKKENDSRDEQAQDSADEQQNNSTCEQHDDSADEQQSVPTCEEQNGKDKETNESEDMCDLQLQKESSALEGKDKSEELDCISDRQKTASPTSDSDLEADTGLCPSDSKIESMRSV